MFTKVAFSHSKTHWATFLSTVLSLYKHTGHTSSSAMHAEHRRKSRTIKGAMSIEMIEGTSGVWLTV